MRHPNILFKISFSQQLFVDSVVATFTAVIMTDARCWFLFIYVTNCVFCALVMLHFLNLAEKLLSKRPA